MNMELDIPNPSLEMTPADRAKYKVVSVMLIDALKITDPDLAVDQLCEALFKIQTEAYNLGIKHVVDILKKCVEEFNHRP
jgi:hypothetical protein